MDAFASALDHAAAIRRGDYTSLELTRLYLEGIERLNPELNHYILVTAELALEMARGGGNGALKGVPVSIKELVSLAGYPTTYGSRALAGLVLPFDSYVVARLKESGCPILGKTNTSEFGTRPVTEYGLFGPARNPWNREHTTGGSSGGAAGAPATPRWWPSSRSPITSCATRALGEVSPRGALLGGPRRDPGSGDADQPRRPGLDLQGRCRRPAGQGRADFHRDGLPSLRDDH